MVNYRITILKSKHLFAKGKFSFFSIRFQKIEENLSELEKKPILDYDNQEGSFIIGKDELTVSLESQGLSLGPKTLAGILGEKVALLSSLLSGPRPTELNPRPLDVSLGDKTILNVEEALHPGQS